MNACAGRGQFPIKFNGSIFTVDPPGTFDPDYRQWGGCYWFQNTRLGYWPMLASGDFDLMQPLFKMYRAMLPLAKARTLIYFQHGGAFFPETMHFWGAYHNGELGYGWNRTGTRRPAAQPVHSFLLVGRTRADRDDARLLRPHPGRGFSQTTLLPVAEPILEFYGEHYPPGANGRLLIVPAQALETWWQCDNPMPDIAGLRSVLEHFWPCRQARSRPSDVPDGNDFAAAAGVADSRGERPNGPRSRRIVQQPAKHGKPGALCYLPFRLFGVGKPDLELASAPSNPASSKATAAGSRTIRKWPSSGSRVRRALTSSTVSRPSIRKPLSRVLGPEFRLGSRSGPRRQRPDGASNDAPPVGRKEDLPVPAWPKDWDVEFKLHAPFQTTVEGVYRDGKLLRLRVTPIERQTDLVKLHSAISKPQIRLPLTLNQA